MQNHYHNSLWPVGTIAVKPDVWKAAGRRDQVEEEQGHGEMHIPAKREENVEFVLVKNQKQQQQQNGYLWLVTSRGRQHRRGCSFY